MGQMHRNTSSSKMVLDDVVGGVGLCACHLSTRLRESTGKDRWVNAFGCPSAYTVKNADGRAASFRLQVSSAKGKRSFLLHRFVLFNEKGVFTAVGPPRLEILGVPYTCWHGKGVSGSATDRRVQLKLSLGVFLGQHARPTEMSRGLMLLAAALVDS